MPKDYPNSGVAEDQALAQWQGCTWPDDFDPFAFEQVGYSWAAVQIAFRAGFRDGRKHPERAIRERAPGEPHKRCQPEFDNLWRTLRSLTALDNEHERNITALVEENTALKRRIEALEHEKRVLFHNADVETAIREDIGKRVVALEERLGIDAAEERAEREDRLREEAEHCERINASASTLPNPEEDEL